VVLVRDALVARVQSIVWHRGDSHSDFKTKPFGGEYLHAFAFYCRNEVECAGEGELVTFCSVHAEIISGLSR
jgi:hypothetical protein